MNQDINKYLSAPYRSNGIEYKSPYIAALIDARGATGRNLQSGKIVNKNKLGNWAGALVYMALIDHIGKLFTLSSATKDTNNFLTALKTFTSLNDTDRGVLYALRCSFAHDYSLFNSNTKDQRFNHAFEVTSADSVPLIKLPKKSWNGRLNDTNKTTVNIKKLGDLVEKMHLTLLSKNEANELNLIQSHKDYIEVKICYKVDH